MNKKGIWGILELGAFAGVVATFILIIIYRVELLSFLVAIIPNPAPLSDNQSNNQSNNQELQLPFDFSQTKIIELKPIKQNMYSNSNNIICYRFENPTSEIDKNFTLIGEWFMDNSIEPIKPEYEITLNYEEIINKSRLNWLFINNSNNIKFRTALKIDLKPISKEVNYNLISNKELEDYLKKDGIISWNDGIIREFIQQTSICSKSNDEELAKELMEFVRFYMSPPAKTEDEIYYDNAILDSIEAWNNKTGTSSEYSVVYAMLLRSIGIPARILSNSNGNFDYYFVEAYLNNMEWVPIDIYNNGKSVGDLFEKEILELRKNYYYITIKDLENIEFISLSTEIQYNSWISLRGIIKSNSNQKIEYLKVNVSLLDENYQIISSDWTFLIGSEGLEPNNQTSIELNSFPESLNNIKYINISKIE